MCVIMGIALIVVVLDSFVFLKKYIKHVTRNIGFQVGSEFQIFQVVVLQLFLSEKYRTRDIEKC